MYDENGKSNSLFSGDTLFVGDVGRPDLLSGNLSKEVLAGTLYESIRKKIMPLEDHVLVYPGHGPGSPCGRSLGKETTSTIGIQKKLNYALQPMSKEKFIEAVIKDQPLPPAYFFKDAMINKAGYDQLELVLEKELKAMTRDEILTHLKNKNSILDVRSAEHFSIAHIKGSINIGLNGTFAIWAGTILDLQKPILVICDPGKEKESLIRLGRIGFDNIIGFFNGNISELSALGIDVAITSNIDAEELNHLTDKDAILLDVRTGAEVESGFVKDSINIPLNVLQKRVTELNPVRNYFIYCAGGYRSMIAASLLEGMGFKHITNIKGGMNSISKSCEALIEKHATVAH
jgi:rhodanese-related sulfurtransferase